ncbi:MAG: TonB-dependent receptor [Gammaproteobacteria bacterium]|jgi:iron complex outermembrane receptor protein|nr:MAG: TonB-dependent receptor [Gammaproteobacteria bacterium]
MSQFKHRSLIMAAVTAALVTGVSVVQAQGEIEEVIVTAQKRAENLQDVPIAITAYTSETLQMKDLNEVTRLSALTPNVNLDGGSPFSGDSSVLSASIRGIGQDDFAFNLDPGVGVYLDGVYLARTIGANQNLLDVDRIEILKGPQGTLFGRNTIGGAINIVSHTPSNEFGIAGQLTLGDYNRRDVQVMVDMPITENILTTLSVSSQTRDGWQDVIPYPSDSSIAQNPYMVMGQADMPKAPGSYTSGVNGGKDVQAVRGKVLFHATDTLDVTFSADYTHQDQPGLANTIMGVFTTNQDNYIGPGELFAPAGIPTLMLGPLMGNFYNMCITTPEATLGTAPLTGPFNGMFNTANGLCGPLGTGTWNNATQSYSGNGFTGGVPALGGAGAVGVPNLVLQDIVTTYSGVVQPDGSFLLPGGGVVSLGAAGSPHGGSILYPGRIPRLYWDLANTQTGSIDTTYANGASFAQYNAYGGSITLDWDVMDNAQIKSITGWRGIKWDVGTDLDGMPESQQEVTDEQKQEQYSQELQLTGKAFDDRLDYVLGLYYFTESGYVHDFVPFNTAYLWIYDYKNDVSTDSYAIYTHLDYQITDDLGLTFGARYSIEQKEFEGGQGDLNGFSYKLLGCNDPNAIANTYPGTFVPWSVILAGVPITCQQALGFPDPANPLRYFPVGADSQEWDVFTPKVGLQYHVNDNLMAYFSYSEGFKSGGWTTRLSEPISDSADARFDPEYDTTFEIGMKSDWFDNHLRLNVAAFYSEYDGIQINVQEGPSPVYQNAGDAEIIGVEMELQTVLDNGFALDINAGYIDAEYSRLEDCLLYQDLNDDDVCSSAEGSSYSPIWGGFSDGSGGIPETELPKTPEYKLTISPSYEYQLANESMLRLMMDYTKTASMQNTAPNTPLLRRPETDMVNASIHWTPANERFELVAGVSNLTDERYLVVGSTNSAAAEIVGSYNAPRMWYFSTRVRF